MKTIVLGAGQVGRTVVQSFVDAHPTEPTDIIVIDQNAEALKSIRESFPCNIHQGDAAHPDVLYSAGVDECDVLIAVTGSDETNFVACQVAYNLYETPNRIARIRHPSYVNFEDAKELTEDGFHVSLAVTPELTVVDRILQLIRYPGTIDVVSVADNQITVALVEVNESNEIFNGYPNLRPNDLAVQGVQTLAIKRDSSLLDPSHFETYVPQSGDLLLLVGDEDTLRKACNQTYRQHKSQVKRIVIAGGGNIGTSLAKELLIRDSNVTLDLIDADANRANKINEELSAGRRLAVIHGDVTDLRFLSENRIKDADLFIAVTNNDLVNLVASLQSKQLNIKTAFTLVGNSSYVNPLRGAGIKVPISPQQSTKNVILSAVRERTLASFNHLERIGADLVEVQLAQESVGSSVAAGKSIQDLRLPQTAHIVAVVRRDSSNNALTILSNPDDLILHEDDRVLCLLEDQAMLHKLERLFRLKPQI